MASQLKKNISFLVGADIISKLLPFMTFPYLTRALGPEMYGKYGFAINVAAFFMLLSSPGFVPYGVRAAAQHPGREQDICAKIIALRLVFSIVGMISLVLYTLFLVPDDKQIRLLLLLSGLLMLPGAFNLDWFLTGKSLIVPVAIASVISQIIYTVTILLFVTNDQSAWVVPVGTLAGELVCICILLYVVGRYYGLQWPHLSRQDFREIVPSAMLLGLASFMSLTYNNVDTILLGYLRPMEEVGLYTATYKIMMIVMSFLAILSKVFFPLFASSVGNREDSQTNSDLFLKILFFTSLPLMFGGMLLAEPIVQFILGNKYSGSGLLLTLLLPNVLAGGLANYYASMKLVALNKNKEYLVSVSIGALSNLLLNIIFIPLWGAKAAAVTTCLSYYLVAIVSAWFGRSEKPAPIWHHIKLPLFASLIMIGSILIIMLVIPKAHVLVLVSFGAMVYCSIWLFCKKKNPVFLNLY